VCRSAQRAVSFFFILTFVLTRALAGVCAVIP
jgi:hypothetical protein